MILTVHAVFGAAVASLVPSKPILGFTLGFASHFLLDAIPHRDYDLLSTKSDIGEIKKPIQIISLKLRFLRDIFLVSMDAFLGILLAFVLFFNPLHPFIFLIGAFASLIPDFFTFLYLILRHKPLALFFNFHIGVIHSKMIFKIKQTTGVLFQLFTVTILILLLYFLSRF